MPCDEWQCYKPELGLLQAADRYQEEFQHNGSCCRAEGHLQLSVSRYMLQTRSLQLFSSAQGLVLPKRHNCKVEFGGAAASLWNSGAQRQSTHSREIDLGRPGQRL